MPTFKGSHTASFCSKRYPNISRSFDFCLPDAGCFLVCLFDAWRTKCSSRENHAFLDGQAEILVLLRLERFLLFLLSLGDFRLKEISSACKQTGRFHASAIVLVFDVACRWLGSNAQFIFLRKWMIINKIIALESVTKRVYSP